MSPNIVLTPEAMRAIKEASRNLAKSDPNFAKDYSKAKAKVSASIRVEKILEANPEIKDERERKQQLREKRKAEREAENAKLESRRLERQSARDTRKKLEQDIKDKKKADFDRRVNDASYSEEQIKCLVKVELYHRENAGNKECKVLVSFKKDGKYTCQNEVFGYNENETEEEFNERMENELIGMLISVKEEHLS